MIDLPRKLRTVHGGKHSALCVEVRAWRHSDGGIDGGRPVLAGADGVGYAAECERAWRALGEAGQEDAAPFDWEFVPRWLRAKLESVL